MSAYLSDSTYLSDGKESPYGTAGAPVPSVIRESEARAKREKEDQARLTRLAAEQRTAEDLAQFRAKLAAETLAKPTPALIATIKMLRGIHSAAEIEAAIRAADATPPSKAWKDAEAPEATTSGVSTTHTTDTPLDRATTKRRHPKRSKDGV